MFSSLRRACEHSQPAPLTAREYLPLTMQVAATAQHAAALFACPDVSQRVSEQGAAHRKVLLHLGAEVRAEDAWAFCSQQGR